MKDMKLIWKKTDQDIKAAKEIVNIIMEYIVSKGFSLQKKAAVLACTIDCGQRDVIIIADQKKESLLQEFLLEWDKYFDDKDFPYVARTPLTLQFLG